MMLTVHARPDEHPCRDLLLDSGTTYVLLIDPFTPTPAVVVGWELRWDDDECADVLAVTFATDPTPAELAAHPPLTIDLRRRP